MVIAFSNLICFGLIFLYIIISTTYKYVKNITIDYKVEFLNLLLFLSILFIISLTLFPIKFGYKFKGFEIFNIIPFRIVLKMFFEYPFWEFLYNVVGNIVLFVPFGFFIYIKYNKNKSNALLAIFIMTLSIEFIQGFIPYRFCEIDDIILNTFGGYIGITIYNLLELKFNNTKKVQTKI